MSKEAAYVTHFKSLWRKEPTNENLDDIERELYALGSDRATVIMFAAFVENHLERLLSSKMRDLNSDDRQRLFGPDRSPLGDFGAKIIMAYALKSIGPITKNDLDLVRLLRNGFAHSRMSFTFETPEVRAVCEQFKLITQFNIVVPADYKRSGHPTDPTHPKVRFVCACHDLSYRLTTAPFYPREGDTAFPNDDPLP